MFCKHCGAAIDQSDSFCPNCGAGTVGGSQAMPAANGRSSSPLVIVLVALIAVVSVALVAILVFGGSKDDKDEADTAVAIATTVVPTTVTEPTTTQAPQIVTSIVTVTQIVQQPVVQQPIVIMPPTTVPTYGGGGSYKTGGYIIPGSDSRYLSEWEVESMSTNDLIYAINEIYARKGYIFSDSDFAAYFNSKSWYSPTLPASQFSPSMFNPYEQANVNLLKAERESRR